jgi:DNA-3-methyladenine glycosylase
VTAAPGAAGPARTVAAEPVTLDRGWFDRPAERVARDLLGCVLVRAAADGLVAAVIVETEAYAGQADPASHAFRGRTARNAVMFGPAGHAYVYFTYGMHFCVNLVCLGENQASAVLLRAGRVTEGAGLATARRGGGNARRTGAAAARPAGSAVIPERELARGPARLCQALGIDRALDGADVCDPGSPLQVCGPPPGQAVSAAAISRGPRVGVSRAAEIEWRFWISGEPCVSAYRPYQARRRASAKPVTATARDDGTMHG